MTQTTKQNEIETPYVLGKLSADGSWQIAATGTHDEMRKLWKRYVGQSPEDALRDNNHERFEYCVERASRTTHWGRVPRR